MMKKMLFIMNPYSGQRRANRYLTEILGLYNRAGYEITVHMTAGPGDGARAVGRCAADKDVVVCCGGDGTFNEVITGLMQNHIDVPVGYIPAGSTNDFAATMHLPTNTMQAAQLVLTGKPTAYDMGKFGDR